MIWGLAFDQAIWAMDTLARTRARTVYVRRWAQAENWWTPLLDIAGYLVAYSILMLIAWIEERISTRRQEREAPKIQRQLHEARRMIANRVR